MKAKDFMGQRFGRLVVIGEVPKEERPNIKKRFLICQCDCGNITKVQASNLTTGNSMSCGCLAIELMRKQRERKAIGERFGRLLVQSTYYDKNNKRRAICKCDCGNIADILVNDLFNNITKSCGCLRKEISKQQAENITGQKFYELTAIKRLDNYITPNGNTHTQWLFQCSCGKMISALTANVKSGKTKSCGHIGHSYPEYLIQQFLQQHNINFEFDSSLPGLINPSTQKALRMDFIIKKNDNTFFIIEHQGEQHFYSSDDTRTIGKLQREVTDAIKKEYCKNNNIKLYETRYDEDYITHLKNILKENELYNEEQP